MTNENIPLDRLTDLLATTGVLLISSGANSARTSRNLDRIAGTFGLGIENFFSYSGIVLTVENLKTGEKRTVVRKITHHGVNFSIISAISILSWETQKLKTGIGTLEEKIYRISGEKAYPEWLKCVGIGFATAALSQIFEGGANAFFVAFLSAIAGFFGRMLLLKHHFNLFVSFFVAAFISASVVNFFRYMGLQDFRPALAACVLWMIPGVPLINGFLDILEAHIVSGGAKLTLGGILIFMIAIGFSLSLFVFGYGYSF